MDLKTIFKFNPYTTGHALFVKANKDFKKDDLQLFFHVLKQTSWDDKSKVGSCRASFGDEQKEVYVKFNEDEIGGLIRTLEKGVDTNFFHRSASGSTQISLKIYVDKKDQKKFSLSINKHSSIKFGISIELGEAVALKNALEEYLSCLYKSRIQKSLKYQQENFKRD
tara:strand:+ start:134 stop:634 length:501 start_codon:yes stop_codon:yes gene_type:complete